jgi:di/tricarboxylate transporter
LGSIAVAAGNSPALLLAVSMNTSGGSSDTVGSGFGAPAAGSGFTQQAQFWGYGVNLATLETATITGTSGAGLFNAPDTDD